MEWLRPPSDDPGATLRWVRRVELAFVPFAAIVALTLLARGSDMWWLGGVSAGLGLLAALMMGPAIRRAEARTLVNPAAWAAWRERAERVSVLSFVALAALAVGLAYAFSGPGLALFFTATFLLASAAASAVHRRAG